MLYSCCKKQKEIKLNIFILDENPEQAAKWLCDKHVVKMIIETAQLLCSSHWKNGTTAPYKLSFPNHPCTKWTEKSLSNYEWLVKHGIALCQEYTERYGKIHKTQSVIEWCFNNKPNIPDIGLTPFVAVIKKNLWETCFVENNPVQTYRNYYIFDKARFAKWKQNKPFWWNINENN